MQPTFIYITCKDKAEAMHIGKALLEKHLVACINVIEKMPPNVDQIRQYCYAITTTKYLKLPAI